MRHLQLFLHRRSVSSSLSLPARVAASRWWDEGEAGVGDVLARAVGRESSTAYTLSMCPPVGAASEREGGRGAGAWGKAEVKRGARERGGKGVCRGLCMQGRGGCPVTRVGVR